MAGHPGGDVLDRALAVARTNATKVPGQAGFFHAVAGERSPLNRQSSRIAKPFATHPFLGGGTKPTVASPEEQAFIAKGNAQKGNPQATKIEQEYVKAADTQREVQAKPQGGARGGNGIPGAALSAPNAMAVGTRALGLLGAHIPLGSAAPAAISALGKLGLTGDARQQVIAGFSQDPTLNQPGTRGALAAAALARGNSLPAHPNTRQLLTAAITDEHKPSYWDALKNLPKDALYTPVYAAQGGFALGHATRAALPTALGGQGNTDELKAIGQSQLAQIEHPGAFVQQHPFQAALAVIGAAKGVGGLAGKVANLPETARDVTLSRYPLEPINRGTLDQNLTVRAAQKVSDKLLAKGPEVAQSNALKNRVQGANTQIVRERSLQDRKDYSEYADARKGISRRRQMSILQNEAQGLTAPEREQFYTALGEKPTRTSQAKLAGAQAKKFGAALTDKEQRFLDAARGVAKQRTQELVGEGRLAPEDALRRDFQPLAHVRAQQGDPTATRVLDLETEIRGLHDKIASAPAVDQRVTGWQKQIEGLRSQQGEAIDRELTKVQGQLRQATRVKRQSPGQKIRQGSAPGRIRQLQLRQNDLLNRKAELANFENAPMRTLRGRVESAPTRQVIQDSIEQANREHQAAVEKFATEQKAQGADPFRVPMQLPRARSEYAYPGQPVRANTNLPISGIGKGRSYGDLFRSGNYTQTPEAFNRQLLEVHTAQDARAFVQHITDPANGLATPAPNGMELPEAVRENYVLRNRDNLRTKPANADASVDAADFSNSEADALSTLKNLNEEWSKNPTELQRVPLEGDFVLIPKPVYEQVAQTVARVRPGSLGAKVQAGTHAFKTGVLMTRPTYPLTNLVQGVGQGAIRGTGLVSWTRAIRDTLPTLPGVEDAGFVAREFGHGASQTARSYLDEGRTFMALKQATIGNYIKGIRNLSIYFDNLARKATANKLAVGEAKKLQGYGKFHRVLSRVNNDTIDWLQKMADGDTPETRAAANRVIEGMQEVQGAYGQMRSRPELDFAIPFHRWQRFILKLTLKTLPLKYPGRTLAFYQLGQLGQQAANQQGALPQYLQEPINLAGSPESRLTGSFAKVNSLASLGTTLEPTTTGAPDISGALGSLSPYLGIGYGELAGKDLQTGNPLRNAEGQPITSLADRARFIGNQIAGFVPPIGALAGGQTGMANTSIPLPGLTQKLPAKKGVPAKPTGPTVDIPFIGKVKVLPIANQLSPIRLDVRNEPADESAGFKSLASALRLAFQHEIQAKAKTMTVPERNALVAKYQKIGAEAQRRQAYYAANPKALAALISGGTGKR